MLRNTIPHKTFHLTCKYMVFLRDMSKIIMMHTLHFEIRDFAWILLSTGLFFSLLFSVFLFLRVLMGRNLLYYSTQYDLPHDVLQTVSLIINQSNQFQAAKTC